MQTEHIQLPTIYNGICIHNKGVRMGMDGRFFLQRLKTVILAWLSPLVNKQTMIT